MLRDPGGRAHREGHQHREPAARRAGREGHLHDPRAGVRPGKLPRDGDAQRRYQAHAALRLQHRAQGRRDRREPGRRRRALLGAPDRRRRRAARRDAPGHGHPLPRGRRARHGPRGPRREGDHAARRRRGGRHERAARRRHGAHRLRDRLRPPLPHRRLQPAKARRLRAAELPREAIRLRGRHQGRRSGRGRRHPHLFRRHHHPHPRGHHPRVRAPRKGRAAHAPDGRQPRGHAGARFAQRRRGDRAAAG